MKSYETEFKGTFITIRKDVYGLDAVLTYPELGFEISDQENVDELFSLVFDSIQVGETLARAIRLTSAVIVRVREAVEA